MTMNFKSWGLLVALSILWGGAFFFAAVAVREVPPFTVVLMRVAIAAFCLYALLYLQNEPLPRKREIYFAFLIMGIFNNIIPFSLLFWAQTHIASGLASILNAATPIFSIIIAHLVLADERIQLHKLIGVIVGMLGVAVLVGGDLMSGYSIATLGVIACLGAALSYGVGSVYGRRFAQLGIASKTAAFGQLAASTLLMLPIVLLLDQPWTLPMPSLAVVGAIVALAVFSTAVAYLIYFHLLATAGAVNSALVTLLIPPSAIALGVGFLDEQLEQHHYFGMLLVTAGLLLVDGRLFARRAST